MSYFFINYLFLFLNYLYFYFGFENHHLKKEIQANYLAKMAKNPSAVLYFITIYLFIPNVQILSFSKYELVVFDFLFFCS